MGEATGIWLATNSAPLRERLLGTLPQHPEFELLGDCYPHDASLERQIAASRPQVLLVDWPPTGRPRRGLAALRQVASFAPKVLLLVDSAPDELVEAILKHRLHGYLLHGSSHWECLRAIARVRDGEVWIPRSRLAAAVAGIMEERVTLQGSEALAEDGSGQCTEREMQIVGLVRQGMTNKQIGRELGIVEDTVKKHLQHIYDKVGVRRRSLLAPARNFSSSREASWSS